MKIEVNKYYGESLINALRQAAICGIPEVRPIAFKVGTASNVLEISDLVEEDMTEFISNVSSSVYETSSNSELFNLEVEAHGVLTVNQLCSGEIAIANRGIEEVLHTFAPIKVTVYFRKAAGSYREKENESFLENNSVDTSNLVVVNSRHCPVQKFIQVEENRTDKSIIFNISVLTNFSVTEEEVLTKAVALIKQEVNSFGNE